MLPDGSELALRDGDGVSVVQSGQPKRPQFVTRYLVRLAV